MIRKKHALGPRPDGWVPVFPRDKHEAFARKIMLKQKGFFACNRAGGARCRAGPWAFCKLRDDGIVSLICPTCQIAGIAQSIHASDRHATLHGVVFDILVGSQSRVLRSGLLAASRRMRFAPAHGSRRRKRASSP